MPAPVIIVTGVNCGIGRIDGLVNNVGAAFRRASVDIALEDFRQVLEVNRLATFDTRVGGKHLAVLVDDLDGAGWFLSVPG